MRTMAARERGRSHEPKSQVSSNGAGGEYRAEVTDREESANESAEWSGEDTEDSAMEEEDVTLGGACGISKTRTATLQGTQGSKSGPIPGGTAAGGGNTWEVTSAATDKAVSGGRHGARPGVRERVAGRR